MFDADDWLAALLAPATRVVFVVRGHMTVPPNWHLSDRVLPEHLLYLVVEHTVAGHVRGEGIRLEPGTLLLLPPGVEHTFFNADRREPVRLYHLRFVLRDGPPPVELPVEPLVLRGAWELTGPVQRLYDELPLALPHHTVRVKALLAALISDVLRRAVQPERGPAAFTTTQRQQILQIADEHVAQRLRPADLAATLRLSPDYFTRLFRRTFGQNPKTWLVHHRVQRAADRLRESNLQVNEVAVEFGYEDVHLFCRQFKQTLGCSPTAWRRG